MAPSSLIFVVIVGVWAAFFVQYWVRRREHIATARSVDAFSKTMRVLQVRDPQPQVDLDGPKRRSYSVSPTRPVRPQVTVKRAEALLTPADHAWVAPVETADAVDAETAHEWPVGPPRRGARVELSRAVRGLTFVVGLLATLVYAVLSAVGVLRPWAAAVPAVVAVGGFLWVRAGALAARRVEREARRTDARRAAGYAPRRASAARPASDVVVAPERRPVGHSAQADAGGVAAPVVDRRDVIFDVDERAGSSLSADDVAGPAFGAPAARVMPLLDEDDMPLTWDPVPVPRPTYTMKAQAHRVATPASPAAPAPRAARSMAPIVADYDDDVPEVFPVRKVVGG